MSEDEWMDGRKDGQTDGRMDGRTNGRTDGQMDGRTDGLSPHSGPLPENGKTSSKKFGLALYRIVILSFPATAFFVTLFHSISLLKPLKFPPQFRL